MRGSSTASTGGKTDVKNMKKVFLSYVCVTLSFCVTSPTYAAKKTKPPKREKVRKLTDRDRINRGISLSKTRTHSMLREGGFDPIELGKELKRFSDRLDGEDSYQEFIRFEIFKRKQAIQNAYGFSVVFDSVNGEMEGEFDIIQDFERYRDQITSAPFSGDTRSALDLAFKSFDRQLTQLADSLPRETAVVRIRYKPGVQTIEGPNGTLETLGSMMACVFLIDSINP
jgi:hypothetical protein